MTLEATDTSVLRLPSTNGHVPTASESPSLTELAHAAGTRFILAVFTTLSGKPCAKLVPVESVEELETEGVGFAGYAAGSMGQVPKDPDLVAIPDASSFTPIPFVRPGLALVHCDPHVEGKPWPYAPRVILKSVLARAAELGLEHERLPDGRAELARHWTGWIPFDGHAARARAGAAVLGVQLERDRAEQAQPAEHAVDLA